MTDPFLNLTRDLRRARRGNPPASPNHGSGAGDHSQRKHSKFSASGAERWFNCPGSVELSEGLPDKSSPWAEEGTRAHELLEDILKGALAVGAYSVYYPRVRVPKTMPREMVVLTTNAANFVLKVWKENPGAAAHAEKRISLAFVHPEAFGTFDAAVIDYFGTLHVFDYKYGAGHAVSARENLQMIFYALGVAHEHHWNFKRVRVWIIQPRIKGYDGPTYWDISIRELLAYVPRFKKAVRRVERRPDQFVEGGWCHWCKAKSICPLKREAKLEEAKSLFTLAPIKA